MPETKKKVVPLSERETIITYNDAEKTANVYTMNRNYHVNFWLWRRNTQVW